MEKMNYKELAIKVKNEIVANLAVGSTYPYKIMKYIKSLSDRASAGDYIARATLVTLNYVTTSYLFCEHGLFIPSNKMINEACLLYTNNLGVQPPMNITIQYHEDLNEAELDSEESLFLCGNYYAAQEIMKRQGNDDCIEYYVEYFPINIEINNKWNIINVTGIRNFNISDLDLEEKDCAWFSIPSRIYLA